MYITLQKNNPNTTIRLLCVSVYLCSKTSDMGDPTSILYLNHLSLTRVMGVLEPIPAVHPGQVISPLQGGDKHKHTLTTRGNVAFPISLTYMSIYSMPHRHTENMQTPHKKEPHPPQPQETNPPTTFPDWIQFVVMWSLWELWDGNSCVFFPHCAWMLHHHPMFPG